VVDFFGGFLKDFFEIFSFFLFGEEEDKVIFLGLNLDFFGDFSGDDSAEEFSERILFRSGFRKDSES